MQTISLSELINALINGDDYPVGTNIIINRDEFEYIDDISDYNHLFYKHETGSYLCVHYTDDEPYVRINLILPGEDLIILNDAHHLADDWSENPYVWDKLDTDEGVQEFTVKYKYEIL